MALSTATAIVLLVTFAGIGFGIFLVSLRSGKENALNPWLEYEPGDLAPSKADWDRLSLSQQAAIQANQMEAMTFGVLKGEIDPSAALAVLPKG